MTKMLQLEVPGGGKSVLLHCCCAPCSGAVLECLVANGIKPVVFFSNATIVPREEYELRLRELQRYCDSLGVPLVEDAWDHEAWLDFVLQRSEGDEALTKALASAPERGPRCLNCFKFRLLRAAQYAASQGIPVLTTTLASSRWKSLEQVNAAGLWACSALTPDESVPGPSSDGRTCYENGAKRARSYQEMDDLTQGEPELGPAVRSGATEGVSGEPSPVPWGCRGIKSGPPCWWPQNWRKGGLQPRRAEIICEQNFYNQTFCGCEFSRDSSTSLRMTNGR